MPTVSGTGERFLKIAAGLVVVFLDVEFIILVAFTEAVVGCPEIVKEAFKFRDVRRKIHRLDVCAEGIKFTGVIHIACPVSKFRKEGIIFDGTCRSEEIVNFP